MIFAWVSMGILALIAAGCAWAVIALRTDNDKGADGDPLDWDQWGL